jgi:hypothetical protein
MTSEAQMSQPTPIGGNVVTSVVRQYILPKVVDNVFQSNVVFFRINQSKRFIKGGTQIEVPIMYGRFSNGGAYRGFQVLDMSPNDTVRTAAYEWKQYYVPVSVDGRTLLITDSADAIVDYVKLSMRQAEMEMADNLGHDLFGTSVGGDVLDGLGAMIDQSNPSGGNYGGLDRTSTPLAFWKGGEDFTTSTMSLGALNDGFQAASEGGRHPSIILSRKDQYSRYWRLAVTDQVTMQGPVGYDEQLYSAGLHEPPVQRDPVGHRQPRQRRAELDQLLHLHAERGLHLLGGQPPRRLQGRGLPDPDRPGRDGLEDAVRREPPGFRPRPPVQVLQHLVLIGAIHVQDHRQPVRCLRHPFDRRTGPP